MWLLYSLAAALAESVKDAFGKSSAQKIDEYAAAISLHTCTVLLTLPLVWWYGVPVLTREFWLGSVAFVVITPAWTILYMKALKWSELSKVISMLGFVPVFTALFGLLLGEHIEALAWLGIVLISYGIYLTHAKPGMLLKEPLGPLRELRADRGAQAMFGVAVLWSIGAHLSKMRVDGSSALFSTFTGAVIGAVTMILLARARHRTVSVALLRAHFSHLAPVGVSYFLAGIFSSLALQTGSASYVFSAKRSSIIFSAAIGTWFFGEKAHALRVFGILLTLCGVVLLAL